jgi:CBS domain-containing protein
MRVDEVMVKGVEFVTPDATVQDAAHAMAANDIGAVMVGTAEQPEGILTDRDIILRVVVQGRDVTATRVRDVMSSTLFTCEPESTAATALAEMEERQVRRLPVVDREGRVVGIVARSDLLRVAERGSAQR